MKVLDLFCGCGGLSIGFRQAGFHVTGVDISETAGESFELNGIGRFIHADLSTHVIEDGSFDIVIGGPPCKPWALVNTVRRDTKHPDALLLRAFFEHIRFIRPISFLMENVPALRNTELFREMVRCAEGWGYRVAAKTVRYSDFGAATTRRRLITLGLKRDTPAEPAGFFDLLRQKMRPPQTVLRAIGYLRGKGMEEEPDHVWPHLRTIPRYAELYSTGRFGWYLLRWRRPAPSFGNVMKTYILHPDSELHNGKARVISVREAFRIMGFERDFVLPKHAGMTAKYQMAADAVSPHFSRAAALALKETLKEG